MQNLQIVPILVGLLFSSKILFAQTDKINKTAYDLYKIGNAANNANSAVNNTKKTVDNVGSTVKNLFGKKNKKKDVEVKKDTVSMPVAFKTIRINISGIDYLKLKSFEDSLNTVPGINSTTKKFNSNTSTIDASYSGKGDELWDALSPQVQALFILKDLSEGIIMLETKK